MRSNRPIAVLRDRHPRRGNHQSDRRRDVKCLQVIAASTAHIHAFAREGWTDGLVAQLARERRDLISRLAFYRQRGQEIGLRFDRHVFLNQSRHRLRHLLAGQRSRSVELLSQRFEHARIVSYAKSRINTPKMMRYQPNSTKVCAWTNRSNHLTAMNAVIADTNTPSITIGQSTVCPSFTAE